MFVLPLLLAAALLALLVAEVGAMTPAQDSQRAPAIPIIAHDPYFSIWSASDALTDGWTRHWTGATNALCGLARIDGSAYRWMGPEPRNAAAMKQVSVEVLPTRTIYAFEATGVRLQVTFVTPALPEDIDLLSRPLTYVVFTATATDGRPHAVSVYLDSTCEAVVNRTEEPVQWSRARVNGLQVLRAGSQRQEVLAKVGDDLRIDWGHLMLAAPSTAGVEMATTPADQARGAFASEGRLPASDDLRMPRPASDAWPVLACAMDLGQVSASPVSQRIMVAYDDEWSLEVFARRLRPYWRRNGMDAAGLLTTADHEYDAIAARCARFDSELKADLRAAGGTALERLGCLAYRQCFAANKIAADWDGSPVMMPKENFSNGCIATVDVHYPTSPIFLLLSPALLRAQLTPVLDYAASARWRFAFAPHDLGTYPRANGQVYGGGEQTERDQMPVEECGNMLLMLGALARAEGNPEYALRHWKTLEKWAGYLLERGLDPENQLCTDDFAGHLAHNCNLSLKAILAIGAFGKLAESAGKTEEAKRYSSEAKRMAAKWIDMAKDGDHYRLAFDRAGSWSQKYNLVWDRLLGLGLFPADVAETEMKWYRSHLGAYGLPLDNRSTYTKLDWCVWSATLTGSRSDLDALLAPLAAFLDKTPDRVPLTDWFETTDARKVGFQARSVVGGVFIPLLSDAAIWQKWAGRSRSAGR